MKGNLITGPGITRHSNHAKPNDIYKNMVPWNSQWRRTIIFTSRAWNFVKALWYDMVRPDDTKERSLKLSWVIHMQRTLFSWLGEICYKTSCHMQYFALIPQSKIHAKWTDPSGRMVVNDVVVRAIIADLGLQRYFSWTRWCGCGGGNCHGFISILSRFIFFVM